MPRAATFLGSLIGFLALLGGALFNCVVEPQTSIGSEEKSSAQWPQRCTLSLLGWRDRLQSTLASN
jgi:hypothetical protein